MTELLFDNEFVKTLEYLAVLSKRVFKNRSQLRERLRKLGGGLEFADHRAYSAGDDLRYLDWNLYGRLGKLLLRVFEEEEDLTVTFMLDCSASMGIGKKFNAARRLVAALAYIALSHMDSVTIQPYTDVPGVQLFPKKGKGNILGILRYLEGLSSTGGTVPLATAKKIAIPELRRGLVVLTSDMCAPESALDALKFLRHHRFDAFALHIFTLSEASPDTLGDLRVTDVETSEVLLASVDEKTLEAYRKIFREHLTSIEASCIRMGAQYVPAIAEAPLVKIVRDILEKGILAA